MYELAPLIYDLALMLGLAGIVTLLFQRIHQPVVLGYLVAGMIVGPYTPPHSLVSDIPNIQILSELGVIFLMFALGLEFSFHKLTRVGFSASVTGLIEVVLMIFIGYVLGRFLGWSFFSSLFLGAALSISSTTIIIKAIDELGLKTKSFAELIFGILVVEDLLAILLLVALSTTVSTNNLLSTDMVFAGLRLTMIVGGWFIIGYFLVPSLFKHIATYISQETLTIISVALCLFLVCVAASFHYSSALGAFIMGSILAETSLVRRIEHQIRPIRDIFAAVFFISVGMLINPLTILQQWDLVLILSVVTIVGKVLTTSLGAFLTGQTINNATRAGFSMAQVGEFSFIIVALGVSLNVTDNKLYALIVAVSGITTFTTPYLIKLSGYLVQKWDEKQVAQHLTFLDRYTNWVNRKHPENTGPSVWRILLVRLIVNGIIVALIFKLAHELFFPYLNTLKLNFWFVETIALGLIWIIASPFVWGMLFAISQYETNKNTWAPKILAWVLTLAGIVLLSIVYIRNVLSLFLFFILFISFFLLAFKSLGRIYGWFERQLISNLGSKKSEERKRYEQLAPWNTSLIEIEVGEHSVFVNKTLATCKIREVYGVNIVAISHGGRVIAAPRGDESIIAHDKLIALGTLEQIDIFKTEVEAKYRNKKAIKFLNHFTLRSLPLVPSHPLIGKSIRASGLREEINGLIVGLEREHKRILNPDPDMVLREGDCILVVGEIEKIEKFEAQYKRSIG